MTAELQDKVCLVTGGSRGIGAAIAYSLASAGATVVVHYNRDEESGGAVLSSLPGTGHTLAQANLANPEEGEVLTERVVDEHGRLDVLVNNAGVFVSHPPLQTEADAWLYRWEQTLSVNLLSPAVLSHAAANVMAEQGGGRIINIGSRGAFRGEPDCPAYAASKAGLHAMSQSLAVALADKAVLVFAVAPGFVETDMARALLESDAGDDIRGQSPMNRVARPDEIADTVRFLATEAADFLTGGIIDVNGASYLRQ